MLSADGRLAKVGLSGGGSPCAGTFEIRLTESSGVKCGLDLEEASVLCKGLGCGPALQASRPHFVKGSEDWGPKIVTCQGTESNIFNCRFNLNFQHQCNLLTNAQVVCSGKNAQSWRGRHLLIAVLGGLKGTPLTRGEAGGFVHPLPVHQPASLHPWEGLHVLGAARRWGLKLTRLVKCQPDTQSETGDRAMTQMWELWVLWVHG